MNDIINNCSQSVLTDEQGAACFAIAERVVNALIKHGLHISFAESCTGGLAAARDRGRAERFICSRCLIRDICKPSKR